MDHHVHPLRPRYRFTNLYPVPQKDLAADDFNVVVVRYLPVVCAKICDLLKRLPVTRLFDIDVVFDADDVSTVTVDLEDVKAVGLLTVLGLGLGISTIILYKLYHRFFNKTSSSIKSTKDANHNCDSNIECEDDSLIEDMGNGKPTGVCAYYSPSSGVSFVRSAENHGSLSNKRPRRRRNHFEEMIHSDFQKENVELLTFDESETSPPGSLASKQKRLTLDISSPSDIFMENHSNSGKIHRTSVSGDAFYDTKSDYSSHEYPHSPSLLGNYSPASLYDRNNELAESGVFGSVSDIGTPDECRELRSSSEPRTNRSTPDKNCRYASYYNGKVVPKTSNNSFMSRSLPMSSGESSNQHRQLFRAEGVSNPMWNISDVVADLSDVELLSNSGSLMSMDRLIDFDRISELGDDNRRSVESSPLHRLVRHSCHKLPAWGSQESSDSLVLLDSHSTPDRAVREAQSRKISHDDLFNDIKKSEDIGCFTNRQYDTIEQELSDVNSEFKLLTSKLTELCKLSDVNSDDVNNDDRAIGLNLSSQRLDLRTSPLVTRQCDDDGCQDFERVKSLSHWSKNRGYPEVARSAGVCKELCKVQEIVRRVRANLNSPNLDASRPPSAMSDASLSRSSTMQSVLDLSWDSFDINGAIQSEDVPPRRSSSFDRSGAENSVIANVQNCHISLSDGDVSSNTTDGDLGIVEIPLESSFDRSGVENSVIAKVQNCRISPCDGDVSSNTTDGDMGIVEIPLESSFDRSGAENSVIANERDSHVSPSHCDVSSNTTEKDLSVVEKQQVEIIPNDDMQSHPNDILGSVDLTRNIEPCSIAGVSPNDCDLMNLTGSISETVSRRNDTDEERDDLKNCDRIESQSTRDQNNGDFVDSEKITGGACSNNDDNEKVGYVCDKLSENLGVCSEDTATNCVTDGSDVIRDESTTPSSESSDTASNISGCLTSAKDVTKTGSTDVKPRNRRPKKRNRQNVGDVCTILDYSLREWKGETDKAATMRKGYSEVIRTTEFRQLRQIRGDNYCALRSTLFQILSQGIIPHCFHDYASLISCILNCFDANDHNFRSWTFANHPGFQHAAKRDLIYQCLTSLFDLVSDVSAMPSTVRLDYVLSKLNNSHKLFEYRLLEAIKLLMYSNACDLYSTSTNGQEVPVFAWIMYARDTSENPEALLKNHINPTGDTSGLEQIEMFLLAHTLSITIRVFRISSVDQPDFIAVYPDDAPSHWPVVCLIAEDDRHYNVPCD